ncbi:hybrid sensor histidine kinase/response regulator [Leptospira sp. GIMC2001]|uniref:hybrid sensor histidine kinase/response regulator n=1 Tax=Leptospira sp. GIMC2001 TaxID=1513297 RepID=UPI002348F34D|nr:hybrid sensor histidine kinase/response regulator [Leptospira sp. GIMC2001]WCL47851.1 hybrid sensor histidine kinase/response regulator [Leptospira sp. GIMC2001]
MNNQNKQRRPQEPILIVEDRVENQALLLGLIRQMKVEADIAGNGQIALEMLAKKKYSLFIVDLMMPVMDGNTFIDKLKEIDNEAIVLVQTALDSTETIIEIMKKGVFDYIIKPIFPEVFQKTLNKALEFRYLKDVEKNLNQMESNKLRSQLEWLNYKENLRKKGTDSIEKNSIYNLKTSLSQGSGFGAMTTLVDMIKSTSQSLEDGRVSVDPEILSILYENNEITQNMLNGINKVSELLDYDLKLKSISGAEFVDKLKSFCEIINPYLDSKKVNFNFSKLNSPCKINIDIDIMGMVFEELGLNAFKYCKENSHIDFYSHVNRGYLIISVKNEVKNDSYGGIPEDMEKYVLQPFFRIHPPVEAVNKIERFGIGLGLTMVEHILNKHNGLFFIHNAKDHTSDTVELCVLAECFIPIL